MGCRDPDALWCMPGACPAMGAVELTGQYATLYGCTLLQRSKSFSMAERQDTADDELEGAWGTFPREEFPLCFHASRHTCVSADWNPSSTTTLACRVPSRRREMRAGVRRCCLVVIERGFCRVGGAGWVANRPLGLSARCHACGWLCVATPWRVPKGGRASQRRMPPPSTRRGAAARAAARRMCA